MTTQVFLSGLGLGASLIMAIGAQNAHVLRMGVQRSHVALTVIACIAIDMALIWAGVAGAGALIERSPLLMALARWGGAAFLIWYGLRSWRGLLASNRLDIAGAATPRTATAALASVLAMSLLNPHVYLDTVVLLGSIGGRYPAPDRGAFSAGAMTASLLWFSLLGFGAARFAGVLARPVAWKCIEALTGAVMLLLAANLVIDGLAAL
ncbi:LysE/ArgO family amino acid transporter [Pseudoduganella umbonata]|uniref:L-lysine exporter family protein LysE/ArgO n=2 Tax=Pseudoduganella umbonata TaxID=864828 RepID=A0A7W5ECI7_9BURK|nr:LysE/ArgO family amino acid transporter [Pseudoduganella umbonata]MBB3221765.1 L-lysine exporter family protein LysE/ArgO [Pseudoduganella umbonata]